MPIYFLPYKIVWTQRNECNNGNFTTSNLDTEAPCMVAPKPLFAFQPESALPLSFLRCRSVHKNMVGDRIPGVMNTYEK